MQRSLFMDIVEGKLSSYKVYEDDLFLAFLDIFPRSKGHTLVIPKKQYRWVYDVPQAGEYWEVVTKISKAMQKTLKPTWINYATSGLEVNHAHIHILPRYTPIDKPAPIFPKEVLKFSGEQYQEIALQITYGLQ